MSQKRCSETMAAPDRDPPSPVLQPSKRARQSSPDEDSPTSLLLSGCPTSPAGDHPHDGLLGHGSGIASGAGGKVGQSSSFRNVSACNRCRLRKNRCDQNLPSCATCEKASVPCVGYDPITKREIPRSYIFYLEKRVEQLEALLSGNNIAYPPAENLEYCSKTGAGSSSVRSPTEAGQSSHPEAGADVAISGRRESGNGEGRSKAQRTAPKPGLPGTPSVADSRYPGPTFNIPFARVVFAAVQSSVSDQKSNPDKGGGRSDRPVPSGNDATSSHSPGPGTSMRDSFFGLHTKPTMRPATSPDKELGSRLVRLYFEHANPQIPILHKGEFTEMFERAYMEAGRAREPRDLYVLNMVFAIGAGIIVGDSKGEPLPISSSGSRQSQPEEYHASAVVHLEALLASSGGLDKLQAVLLLASFALLRPVPPGLWYIIGVAVRLAIDMGLHHEETKDLDVVLDGPTMPRNEAVAKERGRRDYVRDLRRRLWWCTYSFDRLVSTCVGRPFGIPDHAITTNFPSLLEDRYITPDGIIQPPPEMLRPTYKLVAHHYFRLRLLQSEVLQVLQFRQAQSVWAAGLNHQNPYMHTALPSPFLSRFDSFRSWRIDIDRRLYEWKNSAPIKQDTGVEFSIDFLDLNYWQAIIMLYRQSLSVPTVFEGEYDTAKEVNSPTIYNAELRGDEDRVCLKVAEAGQKILRLYYQLHREGLVNHTYLTTHHLFVAGISYLYAIWHSPIVRSRLSREEVDFTTLAAESVFGDFISKCPPAEACRDAFHRTAKATLQMVNKSGGFGQQYRSGLGSGASTGSNRDRPDHAQSDRSSRSDSTSMSGRLHRRRHLPQPSQDALTVPSDAYPNSASLLSAFQKGAPYRLPGSGSVKTEPSALSLSPSLAVPPHSNASSAGTRPVTPEQATLTIDQSLIASPSAMQQQHSALSSPVSERATQPFATTTAAGAPTGSGFLSPQQRQRQQFSPGGAGGAMSFTDLQGLDFLQQNLVGPSTSTGDASPGIGRGEDGRASSGMDGFDFSGLADTQMDLGFGLGWEGLHQGSGGGQQLDLFNGFFFGGSAPPP